MTTEVVVDTSVVVKWFVTADESHVSAAVRLLDAHRAGALTLVAPASMPLELVSALRHTRRVPGEAVHEAALALPKAHVRLFETTPRRLADAADAAAELDLAVYDAVFLALAVERACPLVTADRRAAERMRGTADVRLLGVDPLPGAPSP